MDKLPNYNGSIDLISGLRPKNNGTFPLMQAHDVQVTETQRLDEMFAKPESWLPIYNGENEGGVQGGSGGGNYVLELSGESGTLTDEQYQAVVDNYPNVVVKLMLGETEFISLHPAQYGGGLYSFGLDLKAREEDFIVSFNLVIYEDKTFSAIYSESPLGGLTKQKVTLAELQTNITSNNNGTMVCCTTKGEAIEFAALGLGGTTCILYAEGDGVIEFAHSVLASGGIIYTTVISIYNDGGIAVVIQYDLKTNTEEKIEIELNDTNFDFYIYK